MSAALYVPDAQIPLTLTVNGRTITARAEPRTDLADFLRDSLDLTGTHLGCEHGVCGACTILLDGEPARACLTFAVACDGSDVETIEGLDHDEITTELRAAFTREHALQCGYCTPGMLITARDLVVFGCCLLREQTSLKAFWYVAQNWKRVMAKRREIMRHKRVKDDYMASWFSYHPVSRPAPKVPARMLSKSKAGRG